MWAVRCCGDGIGPFEEVSGACENNATEHVPSTAGSPEFGNQGATSERRFVGAKIIKDFINDLGGYVNGTSIALAEAGSREPVGTVGTGGNSQRVRPLEIEREREVWGRLFPSRGSFVARLVISAGMKISTVLLADLTEEISTGALTMTSDCAKTISVGDLGGLRLEPQLCHGSFLFCAWSRIRRERAGVKTTREDSKGYS